MSDIKYWHTEINKEGNIERIEVPPIDDLCASLKVKFQDQENQIQLLTAQVKELEKENWADERYQDIAEQYTQMSKDLSRGFPLTEEQYNKIKKWVNEHEQKAHRKNKWIKPIGGRYTYCFTPTPLGEIGVIKCNCGEEFCFKDIA